MDEAPPFEYDGDLAARLETTLQGTLTAFLSSAAQLHGA